MPSLCKIFASVCSISDNIGLSSFLLLAALELDQLENASCSQTKSNQHIPVTSDGDNQLEFLSSVHDVAAHFGFSPLLYGEEPLPRPDNSGPEHTEWDQLNELAKSTYVST